MPQTTDPNADATVTQEKPERFGENVTQGATAQEDREMDTLLSALEKKHGFEEDETSAGVKDRAAGKGAEDEGEEPVAPAAEQSQEDDGDDDYEVDTDDLERARQALRKSGFTKKEIDAMGTQTVIERGLKRADALDKIDTAHAELRRLKSSQPGDAPDGRNPEPSRNAEPPSGHPLTVDLKAELGPIATELGEQGVASLEKAFTKAVGAAVGATRTELQELRTANDELQGTVKQMVEGSIRATLGERFPKVRDSKETWDKLNEKASGYIAGGGYDNPLEAYEEAATVLGLKEDRAAAASERRSAGQVSTRGSRRATPPAMTRDEAERKLFAAVEEGAPASKINELQRYLANPKLE